jgi:hypothetical protein
MKTIRLTIDLTYDETIMHGDDEYSIAWFRDILLGDNLQIHDADEIGDMLGSIKVIKIHDEKEK